jgi:hypothetical protein
MSGQSWGLAFREGSVVCPALALLIAFLQVIFQTQTSQRELTPFMQDTREGVKCLAGAEIGISATLSPLPLLAILLQMIIQFAGIYLFLLLFFAII